MTSWLRALGESKLKWLVAIIFGTLIGLITSFCLIQFWSGTVILKLLILSLVSVFAVVGYRLVLSVIYLNGSTTKVKLLSFAFLLVIMWTPALMIFEAVIADKLILFPNQIIIELRARNGEFGQLKINQVSLEGSSRQFLPNLLGDQCVEVADLIKTTPGQVCKISFLITTHRQSRLNFEFDLSQTNGIVDIYAPAGNHHFEFEPVSEQAKSGIFPVQIGALSLKVKYLVYLVTWLSIFLMLVVLSLAVFSAYSKLPHPNQKPKKISERWVYIFFALVALIYANGRFGWDFTHSIALASDAGNISSFVARTENPQNFIIDALLSNPANIGEYFAFHLPLIAALSKLTGSYASAFMALIAPVTFMQLCGYYLFGKRIISNNLIAFLFAIATAIPINLPLLEYYGLSYDILPRSLYQAVLPFVLLLLLALSERPKYYWLISLAFTLLLYFHAVSGPAWVGVCLVTLLYFSIKMTGRHWWKYWLPTVLVFALGVIPFARAYLRLFSEYKVYPVIFQQIQRVRYASQTKSIIELYLQDVVNLLQVNRVLLSLLLVTLACLGYGMSRLINRIKRSKPLNFSQQSLMISLWWMVLVLVAVFIPLIDEMVAKAFGRPLLFREIRRTMRYFIPMLWLTFFWVCQKALVYFGKVKQHSKGSVLVWTAIISLVVCYGIETEVWKTYAFVRQWDCLRSGSLICKPDANTLAMYEFYTELPKHVQPSESVFPDPDPQFLSDTLIPRYHSLRSVAYTYKDGGAVGDFLQEWWRITQGVKPYLPNNERGLNPSVVEVARTTGASYFYFIHPDVHALEYLETQKVVFQNDYGALISLK